jgi:hypothetical protein
LKPAARRNGSSVRRAIVPILIGLFVAGCGGNSGGGSGQSHQLSREAWIAKADRICRSYAGKTNISAHPHSYSDVARLANKEETAVSNAHRELRALGLPSSDGQAVRAWLRQFTRLEGDLKDMRDSAKASNADGVKAAAARGVRDSESAQQAARDLGMKDCGH